MAKKDKSPLQEEIDEVHAGQETRNDSESHSALDGVSESAKTLTVACKLPHGLRMQLYRMEPVTVPVFGGGTKETHEAMAVGEPIVLSGYLSLSKSPVAPLGSVFALTHNVPADFFREWLKQNKDSDAVKQGLVFAASDSHSARDRSKEFRSLRSGLEAIDPKNPPKVSRRHRVETHKTEDAEAAA